VKRTQAEKELHILAVYDLPEYTDRYCIVMEKNFMQKRDKDDLFRDCLSLSDHPSHAQGYSQWGVCVIGPHLGKRITFDSLPKNIQAHIRQRLAKE
jgi:hypothetical protein